MYKFNKVRLILHNLNQGFDYAEVAEIIQKIKKYDSFLDDEYGENALEMRNKIDEIEDLVQKEENPSRIMALQWYFQSHIVV